MAAAAPPLIGKPTSSFPHGLREAMEDLILPPGLPCSPGTALVRGAARPGAAGGFPPHTRGRRRLRRSLGGARGPAAGAQRPPRPALTAATVPEGVGSHFPAARWGAARWGRRHLSPRMREGTPSRRLKLSGCVGGRGGGGSHEWQFNPAAISCRVTVTGEAARFDEVLRGYVVRHDLSYVADEAQVVLQEENSLLKEGFARVCF